jgi:hypothetical protein
MLRLLPKAAEGGPNSARSQARPAWAQAANLSLNELLELLAVPHSWHARKPPATWQQLQAEIEAIPSHLTGVSHVAIAGILRQATAFTVGAALRMVTSTDVAVMQRGALWTSDAPYDAPIQPTITKIPVGQGNETAIAIEIATPIAADVHAFLTSHSLPVCQLIVLGPPGGARDNAIAKPEEA